MEIGKEAKRIEKPLRVTNWPRPRPIPIPDWPRREHAPVRKEEERKCTG